MAFFSIPPLPRFVSFFFFNDTATTEIYTLSLHDALPILPAANRLAESPCAAANWRRPWFADRASGIPEARSRSEEHTSELQSHLNLVCRLLLEKKKTSSRLLSTDSSRSHHAHPSTPHSCT